MPLVRVLALFLAAILGLHAQPVDVLPVSVADGARSLNGAWSFKYIPALDAGADEAFTAPGFDATAWKTIAVPGHWELQGFADPRYEDDVQPGLGLYRRAFRTGKFWRGQRVFLRFEGVLYGFSAFVNGKPVGEWASGFNAATFDITDALAPEGADNILAVRVTTRSKGWEFDTMDCWALSGIYRDVTLFALPATHLKDYTARTTLQPDGSAKLDLDFDASTAGQVAGRLLSPSGKPVADFDLALSADGRGSASAIIAHPTLWTAETPSLYRLELALRSVSANAATASASGETRPATQKFSARLGLRQVSIEDGILKLNGTPIKLRGVNHHEIWPEGRVSTDENTRRDLELIRDANINFIRTSHYPPHPRLLELCDEMGFYVLDEVPYVHGRQHLKDRAYQETLYTRARATVTRDKNHASILFWSLGNENPINELGDNTARLVKELDPTRPVMFPTIGSYFAENYPRMSDVQDIYAQHYPPMQRVLEHARTLTRPIIFTEYAHQRGLARAGTAVQDLWEAFYQSPRIAGGAVWMFQDQGILRTTDDPRTVKDADLMAWLDDHRYYDTHGFFAMDGLVYADRAPQVDYWLVRKVYSPVQIKERELPVVPGPQTLSITVENRHDFRTLAGFKLKWSIQKNGAPLQRGTLPLTATPKHTETVSISAKLPAALGTDVFTLDLRCETETGRQLYERTLQLAPASPTPPRITALRTALPSAALALDVSDKHIAIRHPNYRLELDRATGRLSLLQPDGAVLVSDFGPHVGRHPTINDIGKTRERLPELWSGSLLTEATDLRTAARRLPTGDIELTVAARYPRPGKPDEAITGRYTLLVSPDGAIDVSYDYAPAHATGELLEAGFALALPTAQSEFRWLGQGPYAGYPGKDRHNDYGLFHLNREDLYFPGNRRGVELASVAAPSGAGVLLAGDVMTVDLENKEGATILSHLALVPGERSASETGENVDISSRLKASAIQSISGRFTLLPLSAEWPRPLATWFGPASSRVAVKKPFLRSYDQ